MEEEKNDVMSSFLKDGYIPDTIKTEMSTINAASISKEEFFRKYKTKEPQKPKKINTTLSVVILCILFTFISILFGYNFLSK